MKYILLVIAFAFVPTRAAALSDPGPPPAKRPGAIQDSRDAPGIERFHELGVAWRFQPENDSNGTGCIATRRWK